MNKICNDQTFWYNRLRTKFPQIDMELMKEVKEGSWSDVYIQMVQFVRSIRKDYWMSNEDEVISFQDKDNALIEASSGGHLDIVKYLVENGADIHAENDYALIWASNYGHLEVVKYLVENGANIHAENDEALRTARWNEDLEVVKYLESLIN